MPRMPRGTVRSAREQGDRPSAASWLHHSPHQISQSRRAAHGLLSRVAVETIEGVEACLASLVNISGPLADLPQQLSKRRSLLR